MLKQRIITAVILLVLFLLALFKLPDTGWAIMVIVIVLQGASEWTKLAKFDSTKANLFWGVTLAVLIGFAVFDAYHTLEQQTMPHLFVYGASAVLWLAIVPMWLLAGWKVQQPLLLALIGWVLLIPTGLAMLDLRADHPSWLLGMMALVWMADIAAYFAGRKFGKHKLAPSISPGKTWEGVVGALVGVSACVIAAWILSPYASKFVFLPVILIASWCWVALAVIGDLFESAIKRQAGLKDSGSLLPGHGGLLDRIDALTSTLPIAALAMLVQRLG